MAGFADYLGEASVRPRTAVPPAEGTRTPAGDAAPSERLPDGPEGRFLAGLSPAARRVAIQNLSKAHRDPRKVEQDELDRYDDDTKWDWLRQVCTAEAQDKERTAAAAAQTEMEGHQ